MFGKKNKSQVEAADKILKSLQKFDELLYTDEIKKIDVERAQTLRYFYTIEKESIINNEAKSKAYQDVIEACMLLEIKPSSENSKILDEKIEIAEQY